MRQISLLLLILLSFASSARAQELQAKININSAQVQGADKSVFENL